MSNENAPVSADEARALFTQFLTDFGADAAATALRQYIRARERQAAYAATVSAQKKQARELGKRIANNPELLAKLAELGISL